MKEELLKKLLELVNKSQNFLEGQLPDVAGQLISYWRIDAAFDVVFSFFMMIVIWFVGWRIFRYGRKDEWDNPFPMVGLIVVGLLFFFFLTLFGYGVQSITQSIYDPKAFLIEHLRK